MNRIKDYVGFVVWFVGLGYIVLWPVTAAVLGGKPFGASIFCQDGVPGLVDFLCKPAQPLHMPPAFHVLGFLSAMFVTVRLLVHAIRHTRRAAGSSVSARVSLAGINPAVSAPPSLRKPAPPRRMVKPRTHFGLRGIPQRAPILEKDDA